MKTTPLFPAFCRRWSLVCLLFFFPLRAGSLEFRSDGFFASPDAQVKFCRQPWQADPHLEVKGKPAMTFVSPILQPGYNTLSPSGLKAEINRERREIIESGVIGNLQTPCRRTLTDYRGGLLMRVEFDEPTLPVQNSATRFIFPVDVFANRHVRWSGGETVLPEAKPEAGHFFFLNDPKGEANDFRFDLGQGKELGVKFLSPVKNLSFSDCREWDESNYHLQASFVGRSLLVYLCVLQPGEPFPQIEAPIGDAAVAPQPVSQEAEVKGNLLKDGASFEVGPEGVQPVAGTSWNEKMVGPGIPPVFDATNAVHGVTSLRLTATDTRKLGDPRGFAFVCALFNRVQLKRDHKYTLSAWLKADRPNLKAQLFCGELSWGGDDWGPFPVTTEWQRYHHTFTTSDFKKSAFFLTWIGMAQDCKEGSLWIDGVQLEEGDMTDFQPASEVEHGVEIMRTEKLFESGEECSALLRVRNNRKSSLTEKVSYVIKDYWEQVVNSGEVPVNAPPESTTSYPVGFGKLPPGYYRGYFSAPGVPTKELIFGTYQPQPLSPLPDDWPLACHNDPSPLVRKLGFGSVRAFEIFDMLSIAPEKGKFDFARSDRMVDDAEKAGLTIMPVFGDFRWPSWAPDPSIPEYARESTVDNVTPGGGSTRLTWPTTEAWKTYVRTLTQHYKGRITYWEVLNEPNLAMTAQQYLPYLQAAYEAAKEGNPDCKIVGVCATSDFAGKPDDFTQGVLELGGAKYFDLLSVHLYHTSPPEQTLGRGSDKLIDHWRETLKTKYGKDTVVWNTEKSYIARDLAYSSLKNDSPLEYCDEPQFLIGTFKDKAEYLIRETLLDATAGGKGRFFWFGLFDYESGFINIRSFQPYGLNHTEFDQSPCPELIAANGLARVLNGMSHPFRQLSLGDSTYVCVFTGEKGSMAAVWDWKKKSRLVIPLGKTPFVLQNFFGEPMPLTPNAKGEMSLEAGSAPQYLTLPGCDGETCVKLLNQARLE